MPGAVNSSQNYGEKFISNLRPGPPVAQKRGNVFKSQSLVTKVNLAMQEPAHLTVGTKRPVNCIDDAVPIKKIDVDVEDVSSGDDIGDDEDEEPVKHVIKPIGSHAKNSLANQKER